MNRPLRPYADFFISPFIWIVLLSAFASCEDPEELGLDFQDENQQLTTYFTDTVSVRTSILQRDSVNTTRSVPMLIGAVQDGAFGSYSATTYSRMVLTANRAIDFINTDGIKGVYDSLYLEFQVAYTYGDTSKGQVIEVYRLREFFDDTSAYYQFDELEAEPELLGTAVYPDDLDSNNVLRFKLSDDLGRELFSLGETPALADREGFYDYFPGLMIRSQNPDGVMIGFDNTDYPGGMLLYYHYDLPDGTQDNFSLGFGFDARRFHNISSDLSTSPFLSTLEPGRLIPTENTGNLCYAQCGTGITTRLEFPGLENFREGQQVLINRAEVRLTPLQNSIDDNFTPPTSLVFLVSDASGNVSRAANGTEVVLPVEGDESRLLRMYYNPSGRSYSDARFTQYIQDIVNGTAQNNGLILGVTPNNASVNRLVFEDQSPGNINPIQLRIYYSLAEGE